MARMRRSPTKMNAHSDGCFQLGAAVKRCCTELHIWLLHPEVQRATKPQIPISAHTVTNIQICSMVPATSPRTLKNKEPPVKILDNTMLKNFWNFVCPQNKSLLFGELQNTKHRFLFCSDSAELWLSHPKLISTNAYFNFATNYLRCCLTDSKIMTDYKC